MEYGHICSAYLLGILSLYHCWNSKEVLQKSLVPEQRKTRGEGTKESESSRTCNGGGLKPQRSPCCFVKLNWIKSLVPSQLWPNLTRQKISPCAITTCCDISAAKAFQCWRWGWGSLMLHSWSLFTCNSSLYKLEITKLDCSFYFAYYHYYHLSP